MTAVVMPSFDAGEALRLIEAEKVSTMFCVPTMINAITSHPDYATRELGSLRKIISAGSPLPLEVYRRLQQRGIAVLECYGTSESGGGVMISAEEKAGNPKSVGRPMVGFEVRIVDDEGAQVADGEVGEFAIRGDPVASGYYKQPEIQAETFKGGWFHTGDVGRRDSAGYLYLTDRKKDMVKSGGLNVFPKDIEEVLYQLPGLAECAVVGLPHAHWGEAATAFIVMKGGASLDAAEVLAALKNTLAGYQIPKGVVFVDALPKTPFGKLFKVKLRQDYAEFYRAQAH
jgi:acyl-CoA synthetase (AMP-forming)/AMP-acid ligase II